uniref:Uncharacterized protein n=1 Tax=Peronospora matthiolae TaxID=2874970 RepID=A0AAV1V3D1_9STRA
MDAEPGDVTTDAGDNLRLSETTSDVPLGLRLLLLLGEGFYCVVFGICTLCWTHVSDAIAKVSRSGSGRFLAGAEFLLPVSEVLGAIMFTLIGLTFLKADLKPLLLTRILELLMIKWREDHTERFLETS